MIYLKTSIFDKFKCIAGECSQTCCRDWTIIVDNDTALKYAYEGIDMIVQEEKQRCLLPLNNKGYCKMLDENGLCNIVKKYGDEMLSYTCMVFPRMAAMMGDTKEMYLSNGCPAVLELLRDLNSSVTFVMDDNTNENVICEYNEPLYEVDRNQVIDLLQISDLPLWMKFFIVYRYAWHIDNSDEKERIKIRNNYNSVEYILAICEGISNAQAMQSVTFEGKKYIYNLITPLFYQGKSDEYVSEVKKIIAEKDHKYLEDNYELFKKYMLKYDLFFENVATNMIFRHGCKSSSKENIFLKNCLSMIFEYTVISFNLFCKWIANDMELVWDEIRDITSFYARKIEHGMGDMHKVINHLFENNYVDDGMILLMLR